MAGLWRNSDRISGHPSGYQHEKQPLSLGPCLPMKDAKALIPKSQLKGLDPQRTGHI